MDVHRQVFFNYRGEELRYNFISHLIKAFEKHEINFFVDKYEQRGKDLKNLFVRIDESRIALAIFSTSSEADFVKEIVKEVKRVITATGLEEEEDIHLEEKGESLRTALSMYDCFSIIVRCWGVDMNQRLSLLEILKRIESFKENVPSDQ
ncbi:hypothetical protein YC2023_025070 [Brassica napus]